MGGERTTDTRNHKLFGVGLSIPLPWLVTIIVVGLFQFGIFFQQFKGFGENIEEIKKIVVENNNKLITETERNKEQDRRLESLERRR